MLAPRPARTESVIVSIKTDTTGAPAEVVLLAASGNPTADSAAVEAAGKARFVPPFQAGRPMACRQDVLYTFPP